MNSSRDSCRNISRDSFRNISRDSCRSSSRDSCRNISRDSCMNSSRDSCRNISRDSCRNSSRDSCKNSSKDSRRKENSICGGRSSRVDSTNAPRNNRLSDYAHAHSWSASQLQFQLFARTSASTLSTITAIMAHT
eukprot:Em0006g488a